jgi:hypothetical protein
MRGIDEVLRTCSTQQTSKPLKQISIQIDRDKNLNKITEISKYFSMITLNINGLNSQIKKHIGAGSWLLVVVLATREVKIGGSQFKASSGKRVNKTLSQITSRWWWLTPVI